MDDTNISMTWKPFFLCHSSFKMNRNAFEGDYNTLPLRVVCGKENIIKEKQPTNQTNIVVCTVLYIYIYVFEAIMGIGCTSASIKCYTLKLFWNLSMRHTSIHCYSIVMRFSIFLLFVVVVVQNMYLLPEIKWKILSHFQVKHIQNANVWCEIEAILKFKLLLNEILCYKWWSRRKGIFAGLTLSKLHFVFNL